MSEKSASRAAVLGLLAISLIANLALGAGLVTVLKRLRTAEDEVARARSRAALMEEEHRSMIAALEESFQSEIQKSSEEWSRRLADEKLKQQERLAGIHDQINQLVYSSEDTLDYIDTLEAKLQEGRKLEEEDVESLEMLAAGLAYLQQQYRKPIYEFRELELFLVAQLDAGAVEHNTRFKFFKRMFSKDYREEEKEFYRDEGKREAFEVARARVAAAYESAQRQMTTLSSSYNRYLKDLEGIIAGNEARAADLADFFKNSRKVIDIHQGIMKLQELPATPPPPEVKP